MKRYILISAIVLSVGHGYADGQEVTTIDSYLDRLRWDNAGVAPNQLSYSKIQGTPYYDDLFREGILQLKSGRKLSGEFRYDIYADVIEFRKDENVFALSIADSVARIDVGNTVFKYLPYLVKTEIQKGYFVVLTEGHYSLLEKHIMRFRDSELPRPYQDTPLPARFEDGGTEYYLRKGEETAVNISNLNDIYSVFGADALVAKEYVRKNRIRFRDKEGLMNLVTHINRIVK